MNARQLSKGLISFILGWNGGFQSLLLRPPVLQAAFVTVLCLFGWSCWDLHYDPLPGIVKSRGDSLRRITFDGISLTDDQLDAIRKNIPSALSVCPDREFLIFTNEESRLHQSIKLIDYYRGFASEKHRPRTGIFSHSMAVGYDPKHQVLSLGTTDFWMDYYDSWLVISNVTPDSVNFGVWGRSLLERISELEANGYRLFPE